MPLRCEDSVCLNVMLLSFSLMSVMLRSLGGAVGTEKEDYSSKLEFCKNSKFITKRSKFGVRKTTRPDTIVYLGRKIIREYSKMSLKPDANSHGRIQLKIEAGAACREGTENAISKTCVPRTRENSYDSCFRKFFGVLPNNVLICMFP